MDDTDDRCVAGGFLAPGWTTATNATGKPERVIPASGFLAPDWPEDEPDHTE